MASGVRMWSGPRAVTSHHGIRANAFDARKIARGRISGRPGKASSWLAPVAGVPIYLRPKYRVPAHAPSGNFGLERREPAGPDRGSALSAPLIGGGATLRMCTRFCPSLQRDHSGASDPALDSPHSYFAVARGPRAFRCIRRSPPPGRRGHLPYSTVQRKQSRGCVSAGESSARIAQTPDGNEKESWRSRTLAGDRSAAQPRCPRGKSRHARAIVSPTGISHGAAPSRLVSVARPTSYSPRRPV